jgi:hypothetical protein
MEDEDWDNTEDEDWHGTLGGYTNHDCRCQLCKKAHAKYQRQYEKATTRQEPCLFGGCSKTRWVCSADFCQYHHSLLYRKKKDGRITSKGIELVKER